MVTIFFVKRPDALKPQYLGIGNTLSPASWNRPDETSPERGVTIGRAEFLQPHSIYSLLP